MEVVRKLLEFRSVPCDDRVVTENEIRDELLRLLQVRRPGICQPVQLELVFEDTLPAARLLQAGKTLLELLVVLFYLPTPLFIQFLSHLFHVGRRLLAIGVQAACNRLRHWLFRSHGGGFGWICRLRLYRLLRCRGDYHSSHKNNDHCPLLHSLPPWFATSMNDQ